MRSVRLLFLLFLLQAIDLLVVVLLLFVIVVSSSGILVLTRVEGTNHGSVGSREGTDIDDLGLGFFTFSRRDSLEVSVDCNTFWSTRVMRWLLVIFIVLGSFGYVAKEVWRVEVEVSDDVNVGGQERRVEEDVRRGWTMRSWRTGRTRRRSFWSLFLFLLVLWWAIRSAMRRRGRRTSWS